MAGDNVFLFVPNLIGYARILLAAVSFWLMPTRPGPAAACYGLSALLDAVDGHAARVLGQGSRLGAMLDMLTDRLSTMCLLLNLALLYPRWAPLLQLLTALDVASHWLHMHCSTLQGVSSHKTVGGEGHPLLRRYYQSRALLFLLCAGNEAFYGCAYLLHWGEGPAVFPGGPGLARAGLWLGAPLAALKTFLNLLQLGGALRGVAALDAAERAGEKILSPSPTHCPPSPRVGEGREGRGHPPIPPKPLPIIKRNSPLPPPGRGFFFGGGRGGVGEGRGPSPSQFVPVHPNSPSPGGSSEFNSGEPQNSDGKIKMASKTPEFRPGIPKFRPNSHQIPTKFQPNSDQIPTEFPPIPAQEGAASAKSTFIPPFPRIGGSFGNFRSSGGNSQILGIPGFFSG